MECDGAITGTAVPPYFYGFGVLVLHVTGGVKLNSGSQIIHGMGDTMELMAEQRERFRRIPELFRGAEVLACDMERLETLCNWSVSSLYCGTRYGAS